MTILIAFIFAIIVFQVDSKPLRDDDGYLVGCLKCNPVEAGRLNVHLVPHSHDDVGWLKTLDQYYYGLNSSIQRATVQYIITTVVDALSRNSDRKFVQVETAFFWKWWQDQSEDMRQQFKYLVDNGQIEMLGGGWSMNDEACVHYQSTIDQFTWGLNLIDQTVGACGQPKIGWQIDPFGHSREQASIFAQLGYDGVFFARLDHSDKDNRKGKAAWDFAWQGSANLANSIIYGDILPNHYSTPGGFCWDIMCNDDILVDDPESPDYNIDVKVARFAEIVQDYAKSYSTNNLLVPMGDDFQYSGAESNFINMDRLIKAFKNHTEINLFYSTPSCYLKAVNDVNPELLLKTDDFFPYSDGDHTFWAGYFTSRPNSKRFERVGHKILQVAKQIYASAASDSTRSKYEESLRQLREAMGTLQHHDAVTGTEKQHVASDYVRRLHKAVVKAEESIGEAVGQLLNINLENVQFQSCLLANESICSLSQSSDKVVLLVYNPLAWVVSHYVQLPAEESTYTINGPNGIEEYDIVPTPSFQKLRNMPKDEVASTHKLVFIAKDIPPVGFKIYFIEKTANATRKSLKTPEADDDNVITLGFDNAKFSINAETNLLQSVTINDQTINITQNFFYYNSTDYSGAYIFKPNVSSPIPLNGGVVNSKIYDGELVKEFHQQWEDPHLDALQIIRVYKGGELVEFDWIIGNIRVDPDGVGKEIVTKYTTENFDNQEIFYTDSNGRELIQRKLNFRPDYTYDSSIEPVASNYYPVTSKIAIQDQNIGIEVSILNDRSQGGTSLNPGEIELMIHRRLFRDDARGVGEALNETEFDQGVFVRGSHYLVFGNIAKGNENISTVAKQRIIAQQKVLEPWLGLSNSEDLLALSDQNITYSALINPLPPNINMITFEPWVNNTYIMRLENIFEQNDDDSYTTTTVNLSTLFKYFTIDDIQETNLAANKILNNNYKWTVNGDEMKTVDPVDDVSDTEISLTPMQIRTFILKLTKGQPSVRFM